MGADEAFVTRAWSCGVRVRIRVTKSAGLPAHPRIAAMRLHHFAVPLRTVVSVPHGSSPRQFPLFSADRLELIRVDERQTDSSAGA